MRRPSAIAAPPADANNAGRGSPGSGSLPHVTLLKFLVFSTPSANAAAMTQSEAGASASSSQRRRSYRGGGGARDDIHRLS